MKTKTQRVKVKKEVPLPPPQVILSHALTHLQTRMELGTISYREMKLACDSLIAAQMRLQVNPSPSVVSTKELDSLKKVLKKLDEGVNPFSVDEMEKRGTSQNIGGSLSAVSPSVEVKPEKDLTPEEMEAQRVYWRESGVSNRSHSKQRFVGSWIDDLLGLQVEEAMKEVDPPGSKRCFSCSKLLLHPFEISSGKLDKVAWKEVIISHEPLTTKRVPAVSSVTISACSDHAYLLATLKGDPLPGEKEPRPIRMNFTTKE